MRLATTGEVYFVYAVFPIDFAWENFPKVSIEDVPSRARDVARELGWEGDVRGDECVRFFVPDDGEFSAGWVWKQDNNGTTFVVSPVELPHLDALSAH